MSDSETTAELTRRAVELARRNVEEGGKPFGCLVVDHETGEVLAEVTNQVAQTGDLTAHAEMIAIRDLTAHGRADLAGCDVFVTAYPCPMCLGALYYAAPDRVLYAVSREQEAEHYEDGGRYMTLSSFYAEFAKPVSEQRLPLRSVDVPEATAPFRLWAERHPGS